MWAEFKQHPADLDKHHRTVSPKNCIGVVPCYSVIEESDEHLVTGYTLKHDNMLKYMRRYHWDIPERRHDRWLEWLQEKVEFGHVFYPVKGLENKGVQDFGGWWR